MRQDDIVVAAAHFEHRISAVNLAIFPFVPDIAAAAPVKAGSIDHGLARGLAEDRDDFGLGLGNITTK